MSPIEVRTSYMLPLLVVKEVGPSLTGQNWLTKIQLDWKSIFTISGEQQLDDLLRQHSSVFEDKLGTVKDLRKSKTVCKREFNP